MLRLILLTLGEVTAFALALIYFVVRITWGLEQIGGSADSFLAKIRFGVRAIAKETEALGPGVTGLNARLGTIANQMSVVDESLAAVDRALNGGRGR